MSIHNPPPIPLILVSHLPSASSFYAAITQPLGIRYLSATTTYPPTLTFGLLTPSAPLPLFALTQSPYPQITPQDIHLPASTPKQVTDFYSKSRLLNPGCRETGIVDAEVEGGRCVRTRDLDGHFLAATYVPAGSVIGGGGVGEGASTVKEARRVLQWQKDVAKSTSGAGDNNEGAEGPPARGVQRSETFPGNIPMRLVRRETVTEHYTTSPPADTTSNSGGGISGKAIIGTILGAAAGAAVAYAMVRSEAPDPLPRTSQTPSFKPTLGQRSATYSHPHPIPIYPSHAPTIEVRPARSTVSNRDRDADEGRKQRYIRYAIAPAPTPPPTGLVRDDFVDGGVGVRMIDNVGASGGGGGEGSRISVRSKASARSRSEYPPDASARSRAMERERDIAVAEEDSRSHVSHRSKRSTTRARSHVSRREEKEINVQEEEDDTRSNVSHRSHRHRDRKPERGEGSEAGSPSYASARTHASDSTIKASRRKSTSSRAGGERERERDRGGNTIINIVGRDGERVIDLRSSPPISGSHHGGGGRSRSHVSAREVPLPRSVVSARDVPLPASVAGSHRFGGGGASYVGRGVRGRGVEEEGESDEDGYGGYGGGLNRAGYAGSVAPSDSVSSVGIKRERERLRDRMRVRGDGY